MAEIDYDQRPDGIIKYGNQISLKHNATGRFLTSNGDQFYEGGSGQQVAYAGDWEPTPNSTFIVIPGIESESEEGMDVNYGETIRLVHLSTRTRLHSHGDITSPVSGQQEVTLYGDDDTVDSNDEWIVERFGEDNEEYDYDDPTWYTGLSFVLRHAATGLTLHSHEITINDDQNEVTCYHDLDDNDRWRVEF